MKNLLVGMIAGAAIGFTIGASPCGRKAVKAAQSKMEKVCDCAEKEMKQMQRDITEIIAPEPQC